MIFQIKLRTIWYLTQYYTIIQRINSLIKIINFASLKINEAIKLKEHINHSLADDNYEELITEG